MVFNAEGQIDLGAAVTAFTVFKVTPVLFRVAVWCLCRPAILNVVPNKAAGSQTPTLFSSAIGLCDAILQNNYKRINCIQGEILPECMLRGCETFFFVVASGHHVTFDSVL